MTLTQLLQIVPGVTAVIGSGGKTTMLRTLGEELTDAGHTAVLCTTTHIRPFEGMTNLLSPTEEELAAALRQYRVVCAGTMEAATGKLTASAIPMARLARLAEYVLVEADGSHGLPLKAHAPHEPVLPPEAGQTICVAGLSGLGRPIREAAHRPELFARLAGCSPEEPATEEAAARVLNAEGLAQRYFLNQADTPERLEQVHRLAALLKRPAFAGSLLKGAYFSC